MLLNTSCGVLSFACSRRRARADCDNPEILEKSFTVPQVNDAGEVISREDATAEYFIEDIGDGVGVEMAKVPRGSFKYGF